MKISICCLTYNHASYIAEALESFLMQKTDFEFDIIIGDDYSTDNTISIVNQYKAKFCGKIKFLNNNSNIGVMSNFVKTLNECKSEYIALCDGDDYWTDINKLQKQVDFLEGNPDYSLCFHKVKVLEEGVFASSCVTEERYNTIKNRPVTIDDLLQVGNFIHTPSVVFRNVLKELPYEFSLSTVGDYFLYILVAQHGYIKRLDDIMAVYRKGVGMFSTQDNITMTKNILIYQACILSYLKEGEQKKKYLEKHIEQIKNLETYFQSVILTPLPAESVFSVSSFVSKFLKTVKHLV